MSFQVGQRVRCRHYAVAWETEMGNPHCIIGHFGHVVNAGVGFLIDVKISHGPDGRGIDPRIIWADEFDGQDFWSFHSDELEAVD